MQVYSHLAYRERDLGWNVTRFRSVDARYTCAILIHASRSRRFSIPRQQIHSFSNSQTPFQMQYILDQRFRQKPRPCFTDRAADARALVVFGFSDPTPRLLFFLSLEPRAFIPKFARARCTLQSISESQIFRKIPYFRAHTVLFYIQNRATMKICSVCSKENSSYKCPTCKQP